MGRIDVRGFGLMKGSGLISHVREEVRIRVCYILLRSLNARCDILEMFKAQRYVMRIHVRLATRIVPLEEPWSL